MTGRGDGTRLLKERLGIVAPIEPEEWKKNASPESTYESIVASQERQNIQRLFQAGKRNNDPETIRVAQARLRLLEGRETLEDLELLGVKSHPETGL